MVVLKKVLNNNDPYAINITFDQPVVPSYDGQDFYVLQNTIRYDVTVMVVSDYSYNLVLQTLPDPTLTATLFWSVNDLNNIPVVGSEAFIYNDLIDINDNEPVPPPPVDPNEPDYDIVIHEDGIEVVFNDTNLANYKDKFSTKIICYDFYLYLDFAEYTKTLTVYEDRGNSIFYPFDEFKKDRIYHVEVSFDATGIIWDNYTSVKKIEKYIHGLPTLYFSSKYHLTRLLDELEIEINIVEDFDLKLLIWKYSQLAYEYSGLHINDRPTLLDHEETLLGNYTTYKILLTKHIAWILNGIIYVSEDSPHQSISPSDLKLGDYEVSSSNSSTTIEKIKALKDALDRLETAVKTLSDARAMKSFETDKTLTSRPSVTFPQKNTLYEGKRSERSSSGTPLFNYERRSRW